GLSWRPDGSLFMADWIGGYPLDGIGAVWRIDAKSGLTAERQDTQRRLATGLASLSEASLLAGLTHRDERVRVGSQLELAKRNHRDALLSVAQGPQAPLLARVHGLWGYGQLLRRGAALPASLTPLLRAPESEVRAQVTKVFGDAPAAKTEARA